MRKSQDLWVCTNKDEMIDILSRESWTAIHKPRSKVEYIDTTATLDIETTNTEDDGFLYSIAMDPYSFSMNHVTPKGSIEQQVYLATYDTIKKLADAGPCVLIGRCADYALKDRSDVVNLFITAPLENRIKRVAARNNISESEAKDRIKKTDKSRASYYNYYSSKEWGDAKSYDLCIDSSLLGIEGTVELLKELVLIKGLK